MTNLLLTLKRTALGAALIAASSSALASITITYEVIGQPEGEAHAHTPGWQTRTVEEENLQSILSELRSDPTIGRIEIPVTVTPIRPYSEESVYPSVHAADARSSAVVNDPELGQQKVWRSVSEHAGSMSTEQAIELYDRTKTMNLGLVDGGFVETNDMSYVAGANLSSRGSGRGAEFRENILNPTCTDRHGTLVGHLPAAKSNNGIGMAGIANADVYAARVFDCGGTASSTDIADAVKWLGGYTVDGVPDIPEPVDVINMSLSGASACPGYLQDALNKVRARGIVVLAAAGNDNRDTESVFPANCDGVITVGANDFEGAEASFSNYGKEVDVYAPGVSVFSMRGTNSYVKVSGTSFSAPIAAAHALLIKAVEPSADEHTIIQLMQASLNPITAGRRETIDNFGILDSLKLARAIQSDSYSARPLTHALLHEDRTNTLAYTQPGTGLDLCNLYEVDTTKIGVERPDGYVYKAMSVPLGQDFLVANGTEVSQSRGTRLLLDGLTSDTHQYGLAVCAEVTGECTSDILINLNAEQAQTDAFCP